MQIDRFTFTPQPKSILVEQNMKKSSVKERLDSIIENDYTVLRKGKEMDTDDLLLRNHNPLILQYVREIYNEYHIPDPLGEHQYESRISRTPSGKKTTKKKKMHLMSNQTVKYQTPVRQRPREHHIDESNDDFDLVEDEISLIKKDFLHNDTTIRASMSYFDTTHHQQKRSQSFDRYFTSNQNQREIDQNQNQIHPNRNRNQMIVLNELKPPAIEQQGSQSSSSKIPQIRVPGSIQLQQQKQDSFFLPPIPIIQKPQLNKNASGYVDQSFRYCVGCQQALLHANIKIHEQKCIEFQRVFQMLPQQIVKYLKQKINKFEESIKRSCLELMQNDIDELQQSSYNLMNQSRYISEDGIMTGRYEKQYFKVIDIGRKWCLMTEQINKVNWFLKIRERIKKQFNL